MPPMENDSNRTSGSPDLESTAADQPAVRAEFGALSHVGLRRTVNQDHFAVVRRTRGREILLTNVDTRGLRLASDEAHVLIVADGIGGCGFGELASEMILRIGWDLAGNAPSWTMKFEPRIWSRLREQVLGFTRRMQQELREYAAAHPEVEGMGTTWTCAYVMGTDAIIAHAGDSRAYLFRDGNLEQLTEDHTLAQEMQNDGVPAADTRRFRHILTNSFSVNAEEVHIDVGHIGLRPGDRILVCSDGLSGMVPDPEIADCLNSVAGSQAACEALVSLALEHGGRDNVTVIVGDIREVESA
jgi:protein phosphatase